MKKYVRRRGAGPHKTNYTDEDLQSAISACRKGLSLGKAAYRFGVPKSTLQRKELMLGKPADNLLYK